MVSVSAKCCHRLPCCLLFTWSDKLLVQSHYRGCTQAVYLCMGLCHCHSHSHAGYLLIFHSHIPNPSVPLHFLCSHPPPTPPPRPLLLWTHSVMSHYQSLLHFSSSFLFFLSHLFTQVINVYVEEESGQVPDSAGILYSSRGDLLVSLLLSARGDKSMLVCWVAWGRNGWANVCQHISLSTSWGIQMSLLSLSLLWDMMVGFLQILKWIFYILLRYVSSFHLRLYSCWSACPPPQSKMQPPLANTPEWQLWIWC